MTSQLAELESPKVLVDYGVTQQQIDAYRERVTGLDFTNAEHYEQGRLALADLRHARTSIEKRRKELKEDALAWGRKVDAEAKRVTALISAIEEPVKAAKQLVDDERERLRLERENAEKKRIEDEIAAKKAEEDARIRAAQAAESDRLKAEAERLAELKRRLDAEQAERDRQRREEQERADAERRRIDAEQRAERERLDAERRKVEEAQRAERQRLDAEKSRLERLEFERQARIKAEQDAEKVRAAQERARIFELERAEAERKRLEAIKPDVEKLHEYAAAIRAVPVPCVVSPEAMEAVERATQGLEAVAWDLEVFRAK